MDDRQVLVVGAGPAGLGTAAELGRRGVPATVLERGPAVGSAWRARPDRLRLNSSRWASQLPRSRFPRATGVFPARDDVVRYLEAFARRQDLDVRPDTPVERLDPGEDGGWVLRTPSGDLRAAQVVVATGHEHTPHVPAWPGRERFTGTLLHAADYRNPAPFAGRDVLVVGPGCSGMEIAYDLATGGAGRVRLAVRTQPNIILRSPAGPYLGRTFARLPPAAADRVMRRVREHDVGDLAPWGLVPPEEGVFTRLRRTRMAPAIVDPEVLDAIRAGTIEIVAGVEAFDGDGVLLHDGTRLEPDVVIAATGFRPGLEGLAGHLGVLDPDGRPAVRVAPVRPGLRFVGFAPTPGHLGILARDARAAAKGIAAERRRVAVPA